MKIKKGMAAGTLVAIIITLAAFMLIASVIIKFMSNVDDQQAELICHDSIALRAATQVDVGSIDNAVLPQLCKTIDYKLVGGNGEKEAVKEQIASKMARCWWMFGEGRYDEILNTEKLRKIFFLAKTGNDCFVCYNLIIPNGELQGQTITATDLFAYIKDNNYPKLRNVTYLDYIQYAGGPGRVVLSEDIKDGQAYGVVIFVKNKDKKDWTGLLQLRPELTDRSTSVIVVDKLDTVAKYGCLADIMGQ